MTRLSEPRPVTRPALPHHRTGATMSDSEKLKTAAAECAKAMRRYVAAFTRDMHDAKRQGPLRLMKSQKERAK